MTNKSAIKILAVKLEFLPHFCVLMGRLITMLKSFLDFFDHLPPFVYTFYNIKVDIFDYLPREI